MFIPWENPAFVGVDLPCEELVDGRPPSARCLGIHDRAWTVFAPAKAKGAIPIDMPIWAKFRKGALP
jgi:hypothetical protein